MNIANNITELNPHDEHADRLRQKIDMIMKAEKRSLKQLATESGIAYGTFTNWVGRTYTGRVDNVNAKVELWLESRIKHHEAAMSIPDAPDFVATDTAVRIESTLRWSQVYPDMALIVGAAGTGKTTAAVNYQKNTPNVVIVTAHPSTAKAAALLGAIAKQVNIEERNPARMFNAVTEVIGHKGQLLIIDEAQHLQMDALEELRAIHDIYRVGIVLMGNRSVHSLVTSGHNEAEYAQLFSRFGMRVVLNKSEDADVAAILKAWDITDAAILKSCKLIANRHHGLRELTKTLCLAHVIAGSGEDGLSTNHIDAAYMQLHNGGAK